MSSIIDLQSYSPKTPQANCMRVQIDNLILYFSYNTIVAFDYKSKRHVRQNEGGVTTGKHLNWIDGGSSAAKSQRLDSESFEKELNLALGDVYGNR